MARANRRHSVDLTQMRGSGMPDRPVTVRLAVPKAEPTLRRLSQRDGAPVLGGQALLAESDGVAVAAISLRTGLFRRTAHAVHLLRLRRYRLLRQDGDDAPVRGRQRRPV
jgi:hypothetical protein